jgi:putative solute:sodium symporter small subunit
MAAIGAGRSDLHQGKLPTEADHSPGRAGMSDRPKLGAAGSPQDHAHRPRRQAYWKRNLRLVAGCLAVWFIVSYGFGILLVEPLNAYRLGGYPLGFWFAQQGSIYVFVALIFFYAWRMNRLDREFDVHED